MVGVGWDHHASYKCSLKSFIWPVDVTCVKRNARELEKNALDRTSRSLDPSSAMYKICQLNHFSFFFFTVISTLGFAFHRTSIHICRVVG